MSEIIGAEGLADSREDDVRREAVTGLENRHFEGIFIWIGLFRYRKKFLGLKRTREKKKSEVISESGGGVRGTLTWAG